MTYRLKQRCTCYRRTFLRKVRLPRRFGEIYNCRSCGNVVELVNGELRRTNVCELILQTGVGRGGRILRPHQVEMGFDQ